MALPRVLVVGLNYGPEPTGIAPYTAGMARGLSATFDVQVLTTHPHYPQWRIAPGHGGWRRSEIVDGVPVERLRHYVPGNPTGLSRIASEVTFAARARARRQPRPDAVVAVSPGLLPAAAAAARARRWGIPVGVVVQDIYSLAMGAVASEGGRLAAAVRRVESSLLARADGVVTIHDRMAEAISELSGRERDRVDVIRNWTHVATPSGDRHATRARLGWADDDVVLLHAGNMGAKQGLDNLVEMGRLAEREGSNVRVVLLGDGSERPRLEASIQGAQRITFLDPVGDDQFTDVLAAADVLCLNERPGLKEMCAPSKLTSYFATGRPVVAATEAQSAGALDVIASGAGVVVSAGAPAALLRATEDLGGEGGDALGAHGPGFAARHLSEETALASYRSWVSSLLATSKR